MQGRFVCVHEEYMKLAERHGFKVLHQSVKPFPKEWSCDTPEQLVRTINLK